MAKRIRIKDIAEMAGVSAGTVDRVLHNRGNVSESAQMAVEKVLEKVDYKPNMHVSALSLKKRYEIVVTTPHDFKGEYWEIVYDGIKRAKEYYEGLSISLTFLPYDQYTVYSCQDVFTRVLILSPDAVIIGPTYQNESVEFAKKLKEKEIPFVFLDSFIQGCTPLAYYTANHHLCGSLMCKLMLSLIEKNDEIAILQAVRIGKQSSNTSLMRRGGVFNYLEEIGYKKNIHMLPFVAYDTEKNENEVKKFFRINKKVKGLIVLNSKGGEVANILDKYGINDVKVVAVDLTDSNVKALKNGHIDFLIDQHPDYQGYMAMKSLLEFLVLKVEPEQVNYMPLNIVTKETVDLQLDFNVLNRI